MNFFEAISSGFSNYVNFRTRAVRSEYWFWFLFAFLVGIVVSVIDAVAFSSMTAKMGLGPAYLIFILATILPGIAVAVRRLHDRDKSGWWLLIIFIPLVGIIVLLIWFCTRGTMGPNRFGPDPLEGRF